jgi:hypothetical protein
MKKTTTAIIATLVALIVASPLSADTSTMRVAAARKLWEGRLAKAGGKPIVSEHYPTEEALLFLTAYDFTRDDRYAKQAAAQLD